MIFGGIGTGMATKHSDIDIAINVPALTHYQCFSEEDHEEHREYSSQFLFDLDRVFLKHRNRKKYKLKVCIFSFIRMKSE